MMFYAILCHLTNAYKNLSFSWTVGGRVFFYDRMKFVCLICYANLVTPKTRNSEHMFKIVRRGYKSESPGSSEMRKKYLVILKCAAESIESMYLRLQ
jgi:hypothetical protein